MNTWQGAWFLAKSEFKQAGWRHLVTIIFISYMIFFITPMFADSLFKVGFNSVSGIMDFYSLMLFPCLGFMSSQSLGFYWRMDSFTKKLADWRTMPISIKQIVDGKILLFLINILPALIIFFIFFFVGGTTLSSEMSLHAFIPFALFWIGYSVAIGAVFIYFEMGCSGKTYFWICMMVCICMLAIVMTISITTNRSLLIESYRLAADGVWWISLIGPAFAIIVLSVIRPVMESRLKKRNYTK